MTATESAQSREDAIREALRAANVGAATAERIWAVAAGDGVCSNIGHMDAFGLIDDAAKAFDQPLREEARKALWKFMGMTDTSLAERTIAAGRDRSSTLAAAARAAGLITEELALVRTVSQEAYNDGRIFEYVDGSAAALLPGPILVALRDAH